MSKLTEADELQEPEAATIVDVRNPDEYAAGHVPGAVNIPVDALEARTREIPQDRPVVTYCNMYHPGSSRSERAADLLQAKGFQTSALNGGYPAWLNLHPDERDKTDE